MATRFRFWEIDAARGAAVVAMLAFNWQFALSFYGLRSFDASGGFWFWFARCTAAAFVFLAGVSLHLFLRKKTKRDAALRAAKIFGVGLAITLATWLVIPHEFVAFGILHCIGLSLALAIPLVKVKPRFLALLGFAVIAAGVILSSLTFDFPWLLWLGFAPAGFYSVDYFPLLPWFGVLLLGFAFGKTVYTGASKAKTIAGAGAQPTGVAARGIAFIGRHSLAIYLLHQPLLLAALLFAGVKPANLNLFGWQLFGLFSLFCLLGLA